MRPSLSTPNFSAVENLIRTRLTQTGIASLALSIAQGDQILWETGFGWANRAAQKPADEHTVYSLASISKPITATGIMILVERGLIDLDHPINDYLGNAKLTAHVGNAADATVRRVANHSSGLPLHCHFFYEDEATPRPHMDETIRRYGHLMMPPGETYQYANSGFGLLEYLIERISGQSYADFLRQEIFIPLNLPRTSVDLPPNLEPYSAVRYTANGQHIPWYTFDHPGASAVWASAHDLVRFGLFHLKTHLPDQKTILTDDTIEQMQQPTVRSSEQSGYGIGFRVTEDDGGILTTGHDGAMGGVRTRLILVPEHNLSVAVLTNGGGHNLPIEIAAALIDVLLPKHAENRAKQQPEPQDPPQWSAQENLLGSWSGSIHTYTDDLPLHLTFQPDGDIHIKLANQMTTLLNDPIFQNDTLTGRFNADIGSNDANKHPNHLRLNLKLRDNVLNGPTHAISTPHNRSGNALSYWTNLTRK
jgi:CubicO group peptidase (beta-lactamase class C family)